MPEKVYFAPIEGSVREFNFEGKLKKLFSAAGLDKVFSPDELVAVKIHFGEKGNTGHIAPKHTGYIINEIRRRRGKPFLTDTTTLYRGQRGNAVDHLALADEHGYNFRNCGAPLVIADGLRGQSGVAIKIKGKHFRQAHIASEFAHADAMITLSHATGHIGTGFACALKNLGMGCASRGGKRAQHSHMRPQADRLKCTACSECVKWCPENAIKLVKKKKKVAQINAKKCIGCGQCFSVCRFSAIEFDWGNMGRDLQERIAEYALAAAAALGGKVGYINFLTRITESCDCMGIDEPRIVPDIGLVAGRDPVAVDAASYDLIAERNGDVFKELYPDFEVRDQFTHAEKIGLGTSKYKIIKV